jgi:hypothetical protein
VVAGRELFNCSSSTSMPASASAWTCASLASSLPQDQTQSSPTRSVAVDPVDPSVVYVGQAADVYLSWTPVIRSTDAGRTWEVITLTTPLGSSSSSPLQGPHEVTCVRIHPSTRDVWAGGSCFGVWRAPAPAKSPARAG